MFDRFTDRARKVIGLARQEASHLKHDYIGTEHILLGILEEGSGVGSSVLRKLGNRDKIRLSVYGLVSTGTADGKMVQLPFTPRARKVLELSLEEASNLGHTYIGTEHLLLGLIRESEGIAAKALVTNGILLSRVREEVLELLGADPANLASFKPEEIEAIRNRGGHTPEEQRWLATYEEMRQALRVKEEAHRAAVSRQIAAENALDRFLSAFEGLRTARGLFP